MRIPPAWQWTAAALALVGCADPPPPVAPPTPPPPAPAPAPPVDPRLPADTVVERFEDPDRAKKLVAALAPLDALVAKRAASLRLPGVFVGVVIDGKLVKAIGHGQRDIQAKAPVTADTVFRIGSITKPVTAMALLKLRDEGKLSFDAPLRTYLKEAAGIRYPTADAPELTLRHVLTHTTGLTRGGHYATDMKKAPIPKAEVREALRLATLDFVPGTRYRYSNLAFSVAGHAIAEVSGLSYRRYMQRAVFGPLGIRSAAWEAADVDPAHLARSYAKKGKRYVPDADYLHTGATESAGGLFMSGRDFARFLAWQLAAYPPSDAADDGPVKRASIRESHAPGRLIALSARETGPDSPFRAAGRAGFVGLSWHGSRSCHVGHAVTHNGLIDHHYTDARLYPDLGVGVFAFTNTVPADLGRLHRDVMDMLRKSGALNKRVRTATRAPALERALDRLLAVQNQWDEPKYLAMLTAGHKRAVTAAEEKKELDGYRALHGRCTAGTMSHYGGATHARYMLACERGKLEMSLWLEPVTGLIGGFRGSSTGVPEIPGSPVAAKRALEMFNDGAWPEGAFAKAFAPSFLPEKEFAKFADGHRKRQGKCELSKDSTRDVVDATQHFTLKCRGGRVRMSLRVADDGRITSLRLRPQASRGDCQRR